jgi:hypothetical protein
MVGSILAPALFVLKLPVAQARIPDKSAIRQRLQHTCGVSQTQNGRYEETSFHPVWYSLSQKL